ncbi:MAG: hypothetical protein V3V36_03475 [Candidatus Hydrothermarchaeaceae archaeon]
MQIFYGSAIQGAKDRSERAYVHRTLIELIKSKGHEVISEHTTGKDKEETAELLEKAIGPLPPLGIDRTVYVRRKMIEAVEGDIGAAIFEVSTPSTGTGIEIAHAYLRPEMGLPEIPILSLYQRGHWSNGLSSMIRGIAHEEIPNFHLKEYTDLEDAKSCVLEFLKKPG